MARPHTGKFEEWLKEENLKKLTEWGKLGLLDTQIAKNMGISIASYYIYKKKFPEIQEAINEGKQVVDLEVENALLKKCFGYSVTVKKTFKVRNVKYNELGKKIEENEELVEGTDEVYVPADTTAQIFWLKNRKPKEWREKVQVENENENQTTVINDLVEALKNVKKD